MLLQTTAPSTLRGLLTWQASEAPWRAAVLAPGRTPLSYAAWLLNVRSAERYLRDHGVRRDDRLAIVLPAGATAAAVFVALASCTIVAPVDPASPEPDVLRALQETRATGVVVPAGGGEAARAAARRLGLPLVEVGPGKEHSATGTFRLRTSRWQTGGTPRSSAGDTLLLARTRSATGAPAVASVTSTNLLWAAEAVVGTFALSGADRCLNAQPLVQSAAITTLAASLLAGSGIITPGAFDAATIVASLRDDGATWLSASPALLRELLAYPGLEPVARAARLRFIRTGSATLEPEIAARLEAIFGAPVVPCYGKAGAPFIACTPPGLERKPGSVGLPQGCDVAILDAGGRRVRAGEIGEIAVRGPNVIEAYDDAADTAASFVDGWLRTSDVGRRDDDGYLYVLQHHHGRIAA